MKKIIVTIIFGLVLALSTSETQAHPGNIDPSGCHTCYTNCPSWGLAYGEYHCH
ncbi:MAG: 50S ribosomal protein L5 [uncultured bacterium]|nr:MAG: 50S ribosomal protein L5 [uncultured bacterium]